jgi:uncharacterized protein YegL
MSPGIRLQRTLNRSALGVSEEPQLLYMLLEANPEGLPAQMPKLPLNLCLLIDRSSSMKGERMAQVKAAAGRIVELLGADDYFSLVVFNDRAEVITPAQRAANKAELRQMINRIEPAGGTEMANGLALALQEVQRPLLQQGVSRIMMLTDGRTYGDEGRCVEIARRAQSRSIGITALGVGNEWNEDLLETMTAHENSHAQYVANAQDVATIFADEVKRMHSIFAQRVRIKITARPGCAIRSLDQVRPFIAPVPIVEEQDRQWNASLGDWTGADPQAFLIEVVVPPLPAGEQPIFKLELHYDLPAANLRNRVSEDIVRVGVVAPEQVIYQVDPTVKHWLERLVAYRLQAQAWKKVEEGQIEEASTRLKMASTRLFDAGQIALAQTIDEEAARLERSGHASDEGRKRIKFGTRGLVGPIERDQIEKGR